MSTYLQIIPIANKIIQKYDLCDHCLGRLFSKQLHLSSNKLLGKKLNNEYNSQNKCHICKNLFFNLDHFLKLMIDVSSDYEFKTFSIGIVIKPSIVDRDDSLKSEFRLRGIESVKIDISKELGKLFSKKTKKIIDSNDPELFFTINLKDESCKLHSKPIVLSGRYAKSMRGIPQKQKSCNNCSGKGCRSCDFHGISEFNSVEGIISKLIFKKFGGTTAKFAWIGGEDKSSLVMGVGRPFFVKLQHPFRRKTMLSDFDSDFISISNLKIINNFPKTSLKFISIINIKISTNSQIDSKNLKNLKNLKNSLITVFEKSGKKFEKKIFSVKYKKNSNYVFEMTIKAEGGLPIKRFVIGTDIFPNISTLVNSSCIPQEFDFLEIIVQ